MKIIDGKAIAAKLKDDIANEVRAMMNRGEAPPHLAAVLVGEDPASMSYIKSKEKSCAEVGFLSTIYRLPETTDKQQLLEVIDFLNNDGETDGFIVQLPLPDQIPVNEVIAIVLAEGEDVAAIGSIAPAGGGKAKAEPPVPATAPTPAVAKP